MNIREFLKNIPCYSEVNIVAVITPDYSEQIFRGKKEKALKSHYSSYEVIKHELHTPEAPVSYKKVYHIYVKEPNNKSGTGSGSERRSIWN